MIDFITYWNLVFITSFWCVGFYTITRSGKILSFISNWFERTREIKDNPKLEGVEYIIPSWIANPIVSCIYCLASFHGLLIYLLYLIYTNKEILDFHNLIVIPICVSVSAINGILWGIVKHFSGGKLDD